MLDYTLPAHHTLVVGMTRSGKTTFVNRLLLNSRPAVRVIFDDLKRMAYRLGLSPCYTATDMENALASRWVAIHPERMVSLADFKATPAVPTPVHLAFRFACQWTFKLAHRGPGVKLVCLPEMWRFCTKDSIPLEFATLAQAGAELGIQLVMDTQTPERINPALDGQITELVCFKLIGEDALNAVRRMVKNVGLDPDEFASADEFVAAVAALPPGHFIAVNRLSGGILRGRLW